jgi:hypothetical protein
VVNFGKLELISSFQIFQAANKPPVKKRGAVGKQDEPQTKKVAYKKLDAFLFKKKVPETAVETPVEAEPDKDEENTQFDTETLEPTCSPLAIEDTPDN